MSTPLSIKSVPLAQMREAPRNANRMTAVQFDQLKQSITRIGFVDPVLLRVVDGEEAYEIVDGHHRVEACRQLGIDAVSAIVAAPETPPQLVALALNRIRGQTDLAVAAEVLAELLETFEPIELEISGFDARQIDELLSATREEAEPSLEEFRDMDAVGGASSGSTEGAERPYGLELRFRSRVDLQQAKRALRRAAGKGGDLADGLLRLAEVDA